MSARSEISESCHKLRDKIGGVRFFATNPKDGSRWEIDARETLTEWQYEKMATRPHVIHQFARYLARRLKAPGQPRIEIRVDAWASLNGRRPQRLIDPAVDLAAQALPMGHASWVLNLHEPLIRSR